MLAKQVLELERENRDLREALERMGESTEGEKPRKCEYCKNYIQHYRKVANGYEPVYDGHCTAGRVKKRQADDTCKCFTLTEDRTR